jgi:hypothetical protein
MQKQKKNLNKFIVNKMYQISILQCNKMNGTRHLILESENMLTKKALNNIFIEDNCIISPNFCKKTCKILFKNSNMEIHHCTLSQCLHIYKIPYSSMFLDYMCTMQGNDNICPIDDIDTIFTNRLIENGGVIGLTFSTRSKKIHWRHKLVKCHKLNNIEIYQLYPWVLNPSKLSSTEKHMINFFEYCKKKYGNICTISYLQHHFYKMYSFFFRIDYL